MNARDSFDETPLRTAIKNNDLKMVKVLIKGDADVNLIHKRTGETPFQYAKSFLYMDDEILAMLKKAGAKEVAAGENAH